MDSWQNQGAPDNDRMMRPVRFIECRRCGGSGSIDCGVDDTWCPNIPCFGHCEVACPDCTGEGYIED